MNGLYSEKRNIRYRFCIDLKLSSCIVLQCICTFVVIMFSTSGYASQSSDSFIFNVTKKNVHIVHHYQSPLNNRLFVIL